MSQLSEIIHNILSREFTTNGEKVVDIPHDASFTLRIEICNIKICAMYIYSKILFLMNHNIFECNFTVK